MNIVVEHRCPATGGVRILPLKDIYFQGDELFGDFCGAEMGVSISEIGMAFVAECDSFIDIQTFFAANARFCSNIKCHQMACA